MTTYDFGGVLTDFAQKPFPEAMPRLSVEAARDAFSPTHVLSSKRVRVDLAADGRFSVPLVPSSDVIPETKYRLICEWLDAQGTVFGFSQWEFYAEVGGGPISGVQGGAVSTWWVGPPWPVNTPRGMYFDRFTNDVGVKR